MIYDPVQMFVDAKQNRQLKIYVFAYEADASQLKIDSPE